MTSRPLVLDTNIVLDLFVFDDAAARALKAELAGSAWEWLATVPMRDELERVLAYPQILSRLAFHRLLARDVLAAFDGQARIVEAAAKAPVTCADVDDQKFIDLAVQHKALLLSKDGDVLAMKKRMEALDATVAPALPDGRG